MGKGNRVFVASLVLCATISLLSTAALGEEDGSGTKLGIASFDVAGARVVEGGKALRVTLSYDATICGNPWQGGKYGYGEIEKLRECNAKAFFFEEGDLGRASTLASTADAWKGFSVIGTRLVYENLPEGTTHGVSWDDSTHRFNESSPLSGSVDLDIEFPSFIRYLRETKTYHIVVVGYISYDAFNGVWTNIDGLGPLTVELGEDVDELSLNVDAPAEVDFASGEAVFNLTAAGKNTTMAKVDKVIWTFSYYTRDGWRELDPLEEDGLTDLDVGAQTLGKWWSLAIQHGTFISKRYSLNMRVTASAYSGEKTLATSATRSFQVLAVEELRLTVDGPKSVGVKAEEVTFKLAAEGDDSSKAKVDEVIWIFSHPDAEDRWTDAYSYLKGEKSLTDLVLSQEEKGGVAEWWEQALLAHGEPVGGTRRLPVKVTAEARSGGRTLGVSEPYEFWLTGAGLTMDTNLSTSYEVYPTWPTVSTVEVLYDGSTPIRLDVEGELPAYLEVSLEPEVIEPKRDEEGGVYYVNLTLSLNCSKDPGIKLPQVRKVTIASEGLDVDYRKDVTLNLQPAKWLIMMYMAMDTKPDLLAAAMNYITTVNEFITTKGVPQVAVIMLLDTTPKNSADLILFDRTVKDRVGRSIGKPWGPTNLSDARTLKRFVTESMNVVPAERHQLIFDAHGAGIRGVVCDESQGGSKHPMTFGPMVDALEGFDLDIISFNSCLMAQTEVLYELRSLAPYVVASELVMPSKGLDYEELLTELSRNPGMPTERLAKILVDSYKERYGNNFRRNTTLSCVASSKLGSLSSAVDALAKEIIEGYGEKDAALNRTIAEIGARSQMVYSGYPYADLKDFAQRLADEEGLKRDRIKDAARRVVAAVDDAVLWKAANVWSLENLTFKLTDSHGLNGMTVLLWNHGLKGDAGKVFRLFMDSYRRTGFSRDTRWGEFLNQYSKSVPRNATTIRLTHFLHELHLHVYDSRGHHVGYNATSGSRTRVDCQIPGAIYSDLQNGTKIVILPGEVDEYKVVVDGQDMEETEEPYTLTCTLIVDDEAVDVFEHEMTIRKGNSHSTEFSVQGEDLLAGETSVEGTGEGQLPRWFRESLLLPLVKPFLPLVPDRFLPFLPFLVIGVPILLIIGVVMVVGRRRRTKP